MSVFVRQNKNGRKERFLILPFYVILTERIRKGIETGNRIEKRRCGYPVFQDILPL